MQQLFILLCDYHVQSQVIQIWSLKYLGGSMANGRKSISVPSTRIGWSFPVSNLLVKCLIGCKMYHRKWAWPLVYHHQRWISYSCSWTLATGTVWTGLQTNIAVCCIAQVRIIITMKCIYVCAQCRLEPRPSTVTVNQLAFIRLWYRASPPQI